MTEYLYRDCPACGSSDARREVRAGKAAETMTLDALRPADTRRAPGVALGYRLAARLGVGAKVSESAQ